ncbi:uncharacterized protein LOC125053606 [Pieris napi]|uniref:uncharacterized protein LOC125053606 n=1 Tax=Pieris napi TaxID=78633 RepID=UPI001FBBE8F2|nr:uncharacterized protein LOC125053606 [Pieris napi]
MHCTTAVLLMGLLTNAAVEITPTTGATEASTTNSPPPTVFRNTMTTKTRPGTRRKSGSPMLNYIFDSYATSKQHFHDTLKAPSFEGDLSSETIMDADTGSTVLFDCKVSSLRDKTVSWLKVSDENNLELLTLNLITYTADSRYKVDLAGEIWKLSLSDAKSKDSGVYWCHVSTHPPMLRVFRLQVHAPDMKISKETFLETGETLSLKCMVFNLDPGDVTPELFWYRGNNTTALDEVRGGVLVETDQLTLTSHLQVAQLKLEDAGNYTCALEAPLHMRATTRVHVLQGSSLAELQSGVKTTTSYISLLVTSLLIVLGARHHDVR